MSLTPLFINRPRAHPVPPPPVSDETSLRNGQNAQNEHHPIDRAKQTIPSPASAKALAAAIVEMGGIRRGEIERTSAPTHPTALAIIAAAAKGRAAPIGPPPLPENPISRAVVLCGQKARGEISQASERWLTNFVTTLETLR